MGNRHARAKSKHSLVGAAVRQAVEGPVLSRAATLTGALLLVISPPGLSITLGEVNVRSAIGQRLVASVPVRVSEGESLVNGCVSVHNGPSGLGNLRQPEVATPHAGKPGDYTLELTTGTALYEPMYELELRVDCPGAPAVVRQYVLMLDLPGSRYAADLAPAAGLPEVPAGSKPVTDYAPAPTTAGSRGDLRPDDSALSSGLKYRVREGDTLSSIAARVQGRQESLWALADRIFAANPEAFIRNDANLIRLGAEIIIPDGTAVAPAAAAATVAPPAPPMPVPQELPSVPAALPAAVAPAATATATATSSTPATTGVLEPAVLVTGAETATAAVLPAEKPAVSKASKQAPIKKAPKPATASANSSEPATASPSPLAATIAGIVFGLVVSGLLWLGRNLPNRKPWRSARRSAVATAPTPAATPPRPAPVPIPVASHRPLPSFTVSYSQVEDDALAGEFPATDSPAPAPKAANVEITSELEQLFGSTGAGADDGKTIAARVFDAAPVVDGFKPDDAGVDILLGEDSATMNAPARVPVTVDETPDPLSNSGTIDLHSLAGSTGRQHKEQARDLMDALSLLERDYEEELTASQVLDLSAMRQALDAADEDDDATTLRQKSG